MKWIKAKYDDSTGKLSPGIYYREDYFDVLKVEKRSANSYEVEGVHYGENPGEPHNFITLRECSSMGAAQKYLEDLIKELNHDG